MTGYRRRELSRSDREVVYLCDDGREQWCEMEDTAGQITRLQMPEDPPAPRPNWRQHVWRYGTPVAAAAAGVAIGAVAF